MRTILISDVHGQPHLITNALDHAKYDIDNDRLIFVGDIIDIGFDALKCIQLLLDNKAELLWGNHDLAVPLGKSIWPQNAFDWEIQTEINAIQFKFKCAAVQDNVLITHAGLSQRFYKVHNKRGNFGNDLNKIVSYLNDLNWQKIWTNDSPIWYRPNHSDPPMNFVQIVGHTPPGWIEKYGIFENLYSIDPYCEVGFNESRYRYAVIEDEQITIHDSNEESK
jgi:hypothetical protein